MLNLPHIYIMNIPRAVKRRYVSMGALLAHNVPLENLHIYKAIDDRDFENSNELLQAAINDGFPQFANYLNTEQAIARFGQMWNYCRFWRDVMNKWKKTTLLIQDDRRINHNYSRIIEELSTTLALENFHFLSLWGHKGVLKKDAEIKPTPHDKRVAEGLIASGACVCHIVSPKGAEWILENAIGHIPPFKHISVEWVLLSKCEKQQGFYTLIDGPFMATNIVGGGRENKQFLPGRIWRDGKLIRRI